MFMEDKYKERLNAHCRQVISECLNIIEKYGDTYVAIHRDDEVECVILVTVMRSFPLLSIVIADRLAFTGNDRLKLFCAINDMNISSVTGWHSVCLGDDSLLYMYRQCIWLSMELSYDELIRLLKESISEYKKGKARITISGSPTVPVA